MSSTIDKKVYALHFSTLNKNKALATKNLIFPLFKQSNNKPVSIFENKTQLNKSPFSIKTSFLKHADKYNNDLNIISSASDVSKPIDVQTEVLEEARKLANAGLFNEALLMSERAIKESKNANSYLLNGEISMALERFSDAVVSFKKVLYLTPKNTQALQHLTLLLTKLGDKEQAQRYQNRLSSILEATNE